jgi:large repetitive protein
MAMEDRTAPSISVGDGSAIEGSAIAFTVSLNAASSSTITVAYSTADGTAVAGTNYSAASGTVTFTPGQTSQSVSVSTISGSLTQPAQTFTLNLSNPAGDTVFDGQGSGTIFDSDQPATPPANMASCWAGDVDGTDRVGTNTGTLCTGVGIVPGEVSNAFSFDGSNYVSANTVGLPTGNNDRTLEMWDYINAFGSGETFFAGYGAERFLTPSVRGEQ